MRGTIIILLLMPVLIFVGCEQKAVCNKPYILVGTSCCLDNDNNSICDKDELKENKSISPSITQDNNKGIIDIIKKSSLKEEKGGITCNEWISTRIPDKLTLSMSPSASGGFLEKRLRWKDGVGISVDAPYFVLWKGFLQGQNINYFYLYADSPGSDEAHFEYEKQMTDEKGNILGNNHFKIKPILEEIPGSKRHWGNGWGNMWGYDTSNFRIVDYQITDCNLIKFEPISNEKRCNLKESVLYSGQTEFIDGINYATLIYQDDSKCTNNVTWTLYENNENGPILHRETIYGPDTYDLYLKWDISDYANKNIYGTIHYDYND